MPYYCASINPNPKEVSRVVCRAGFGFFLTTAPPRSDVPTTWAPCPACRHCTAGVVAFGSQSMDPMLYTVQKCIRSLRVTGDIDLIFVTFFPAYETRTCTRGCGLKRCNLLRESKATSFDIYMHVASAASSFSWVNENVYVHALDFQTLTRASLPRDNLKIRALIVPGVTAQFPHTHTHAQPTRSRPGTH